MHALETIAALIKNTADPLMGATPLLPAGLDERTSPDQEIETLLCAQLSILDPSAKFFAEEAYKRDQSLVRHLSGPGRTYIIDPIDNTTAFLEGTTNVFAVMVARLDNERLTAGWIYYPALGVMLSGEIGTGAFVNGEPIPNPYTEAEPGLATTRGMTLNVSPNSSRSIRTIAEGIDRYKEQFPRINERRAVCEHALDLLINKTGDVFLNRVPWPWDTAAFFAIYQAWGGQIAFPDGATADIHQIHKIGQILAPNKAMLAAACDAALPIWPALKDYNEQTALKALSWGAPAVPGG